jgi:predicted TIM-barrel fold metal-dependent hydrolase
MGFVAAFLTTSPHPQQEDYHRDVWEPLWAAAEEARMVLAFHIGSDPLDLEKGQLAAATFRGPGSAVLNYAETTFSGQRAAMKLVASGALDRHPDLRVLISEGGAGWVPFMADRMEEGYRQHSMVVRPKLSRSPREILYSQVYVSFQHDVSGVTAMTASGYRNVAWGSDYPHHEGTFGHTQEVLHGLFDDVDPSVRRRITVDAFQELFPTVAPAPIDADGRLVAA